MSTSYSTDSWEAHDGFLRAQSSEGYKKENYEVMLDQFFLWELMKQSLQACLNLIPLDVCAGIFKNQYPVKFSHIFSSKENRR